LMRSEGKLTATLLPGFWAHAAIYLGEGDDLPALGVPAPGDAGQDPALGVVIEGVSPRVRIASLETCLDADHVLVLRPCLSTGTLREALQESLCHLGKPYDFEFDFNLSNRMVCTGLVYRTYQGRAGIDFQLIKRLGNFTLTGDDLVRQAMQPRSDQFNAFEPVVLVLRRTRGWMWCRQPARVRTLISRIEKGWRPFH